MRWRMERDWWWGRQTSPENLTRECWLGHWIQANLWHSNQGIKKLAHLSTCIYLYIDCYTCQWSMSWLWISFLGILHLWYSIRAWGLPNIVFPIVFISCPSNRMTLNINTLKTPSFSIRPLSTLKSFVISVCFCPLTHKWQDKCKLYSQMLQLSPRSEDS